MRLPIFTTLLFSCLAFADEGDPIPNTDVELLEIPPASSISSAEGTDNIQIKGLPRGSEIIGLPRGWRVAGQRGDVIHLQGSPAGPKISIQFTSPDPNWRASVAGFKGRTSIWNAGQLSRGSVGITTMKAERVAGAPTAMGSQHDGATQGANSYNSSRSNNRRTGTEIAAPGSQGGSAPQAAEANHNSTRSDYRISSAAGSPDTLEGYSGVFGGQFTYFPQITATLSDEYRVRLK